MFFCASASVRRQIWASIRVQHEMEHTVRCSGGPGRDEDVVPSGRCIHDKQFFDMGADVG